MTEHDLRTALDESLRAIEPPLRMTPVEAVRRGRLKRRIRRIGIGLLGGVAVAALGGGVLGPAVLGDGGASEAVPPASDTGAPPIDATLQDVATRVFSPHVGPLPAPAISVTNEAGEQVPVDAAGVTGVGVRYELAGDRDLALGVNAGGMDEGCAAFSAAAVTCDLTTRAEGTTVMTMVLAFGPPEPGGPGLPTVLGEEQRAAADPAGLTWSRGVTVVSPDGDVSGAYELVPAPSYDAAQAAWLVPSEGLVAAATDPALTGFDFR